MFELKMRIKMKVGRKIFIKQGKMFEKNVCK